MYTVSSEIYKETNFQPIQIAQGKVISKFEISYPGYSTNEPVSSHADQDGDTVVQRKHKTLTAIVEIEHSEATELRLVGLQVWRGALLLADYLCHCRQQFENMQIMELGAGVGLTSIAAAMWVKKVVCTDVDLGGILDLISTNMRRNKKLLKGNVEVLEFDFTKNPKDYSSDLNRAIDESDIFVAADVIYDNDLTDAFIKVIDFIFEREVLAKKKKEIFIALEKRFVFTFSELDTVAPMFEYFIKKTMNKTWRFKYIPIDFPQYFVYERSKELTLLHLTNK